MDLSNRKIAVLGLGYVGLPLAIEFAKKFSTWGFDINKERIGELRKGHDKTLEADEKELKSVLIADQSTLNGKTGFYCTFLEEEIRTCDTYIVTVPTPTDKFNRPNLTPLVRASETVGRVLSKGDIVIYESTVYPGVTEEECVPIIERVSGLKFNIDFFVGYSPERINPGDKIHTVTNIKKVTSGSTPQTAEIVDQLYGTIIKAGTHKATSIKVAEAAKVIENSQRDINIAFVNELSKIFSRLGIDTLEVLEAAGTKWNFLPFRPGLVGGHCIGVDPYYLAQKAQEVGYHPEIILAGRRLNDGMGSYIATEVVKLMLKKQIKVVGSRVLMLGITFKENCTDIRNSRAIDIVRELRTYDIDVDVYDPWARSKEVEAEYQIELTTDLENPDNRKYDAAVVAVAHNDFLQIDIKNLLNPVHVLYDVKGHLPRAGVDGRL